MSSLAEERFNKEKMIEGLERSALDKAKDLAIPLAQDLAQDLALTKTVKALRRYGASKADILNTLTEQGENPAEVSRILDTLD